MHVETTRSNHLIIVSFEHNKQNFRLPPGDGRHCCLSCDGQLPGVAGLLDAGQLSPLQFACWVGGSHEWGALAGKQVLKRIRSTFVYVIPESGCEGFFREKRRH